MSALAVVLAGKEGLRIDALAWAVANFRDVPVPDAAMAVRKARGILAEDLDAAGAADLVRRLADEGIAARILPAADLVPPPSPLRLSRAEPTPAALRAGMGGETLLVPWGRIRLLALAAYSEVVYRTVQRQVPRTAGDFVTEAGMGMGGLHVRMGGEKTIDERVSRTEFHLLLDLLLRGPAERLRVDASKFDFSGLGDLMTYAPHQNLRALLGAITAAAPAAATSPGADLLLTGGRLASLGHASVEDFDREVRWLSAIAA